MNQLKLLNMYLIYLKENVICILFWIPITYYIMIYLDNSIFNTIIIVLGVLITMTINNSIKDFYHTKKHPKKYLISYRSEYRGNIIYGYEITKDPVEWIASVQEFPETYILLNSQLITDIQVKKYTDEFKGM